MGTANFDQITRIIRKYGKQAVRFLTSKGFLKTLGIAAGSSLATGAVVHYSDQKNNEEKENAYKDKLQKHEAMIEALDEQAKLCNERNDHLVEINKKLLENQKEIQGDKDE